MGHMSQLGGATNSIVCATRGVGMSLWSGLKRLHCGHCSCFSHDWPLQLEVFSRERSLRVIRPWALLRRLARSSSHESRTIAMCKFERFQATWSSSHDPRPSFCAMCCGRKCLSPEWRDRADQTSLKTNCSQDSKTIMRNTTRDDKDDEVPIATLPNDHTFPIIHHGLSPCVFPLRRSHFAPVPLLASSRRDEVPQSCQKLNKGLVINAVKRIETRQVEHWIYAKFPQKALFLHMVYHRIGLRVWPEADVKRYCF